MKLYETAIKQKRTYLMQFYIGIGFLMIIALIANGFLIVGYINGTEGVHVIPIGIFLIFGVFFATTTFVRHKLKKMKIYDDHIEIYTPEILKALVFKYNDYELESIPISKIKNKEYCIDSDKNWIAIFFKYYDEDNKEKKTGFDLDIKKKKRKNSKREEAEMEIKNIENALQKAGLKKATLKEMFPDLYEKYYVNKKWWQ